MTRRWQRWKVHTHAHIQNRRLANKEKGILPSIWYGWKKKWHADTWPSKTSAKKTCFFFTFFSKIEKKKRWSHCWEIEMRRRIPIVVYQNSIYRNWLLTLKNRWKHEEFSMHAMQSRFVCVCVWVCILFSSSLHITTIWYEIQQQHSTSERKKE